MSWLWALSIPAGKIKCQQIKKREQTQAEFFALPDPHRSNEKPQVNLRPEGNFLVCKVKVVKKVNTPDKLEHAK
jgi:hypothetical protein